MLHLLLAVNLLAAPAETTNAPYQSAGTRRMVERLARLPQESDPLIEPFMNRERAAVLGAQVERAYRLPQMTNNPAKMYDLLWKYAAELLNSGQNEAAIAQYEKIERLMTAYHAYGPTQKVWIKNNLALCYLRMGEFDNCLTGHNIDSCLCPIRGEGVHKVQRGSRGAIRVLTDLLAESPNDLRARWTINIAYMTVGEYPDKVPPAWLIPPKAFASDYDLGRFYDVAGKLGLDADGLAGGAIMDDFDNDGNLDIVISNSGLQGQLRYFHNNGDGTFTERTREAGLIGEVGGLNMVQADYNNDGYLDILVLRGAWLGRAGHHPLSLLRNNGNGTFDDVTEEAGLLRFYPTQTAVWFDYNNDGLLDLFVGNESTPKDIGRPCELYRNNGDGTFTECAASAGVAFVGFVKAVVSGDFNNDGRPDLYLSVRHAPNVLFRNDGPQEPGKGVRSDWKFTDVAAQAGVSQPTNSFPAWFFDYDNDGWPDLFVDGYLITDVGDVAADYLGLPHQAELPRLYHNNHDGTFSDVTHPAHLDKVLHAMGSNFGDLDNDGFLDFYLGTGNPDLSTLIPNRMFRNADGKFFQDVTTSGGFGHLQKGHGVAFGDIDNDGDQDIYEVMGGAYDSDNYRSVLYENPGHGNHWVTLKLEGVQSNRSAIGARIRVIAKTDSGERSIYRTVGSGGSFGCSPLRQEIGLGKATTIQSVEITWPVTGKRQVFANLAMDQFYSVREGETAARPLKLKNFKLTGKPGQATHAHEHHQ